MASLPDLFGLLVCRDLGQQRVIHRPRSCSRSLLQERHLGEELLDFLLRVLAPLEHPLEFILVDFHRVSQLFLGFLGGASLIIMKQPVVLDGYLGQGVVEGGLDVVHCSLAIGLPRDDFVGRGCSIVGAERSFPGHLYILGELLVGNAASKVPEEWRLLINVSVLLVCRLVYTRLCEGRDNTPQVFDINETALGVRTGEIV